jgi:hypothetical protein
VAARAAAAPFRGGPAPPASSSSRLLPLLSELIEVQAQSTTFETIAGRGAMIGFATALAAETLAPNGGAGLFGAGSGLDASASAAVAGLAAALVLGAAALAAALSAHRRPSRRLMEPLLAALTARAGAGTSARSVEEALDATLARVLLELPADADAQ